MFKICRWRKRAVLPKEIAYLHLACLDKEESLHHDAGTIRQQSNLITCLTQSLKLLRTDRSCVSPQLSQLTSSLPPCDDSWTSRTRPPVFTYGPPWSRGCMTNDNPGSHSIERKPTPRYIPVFSVAQLAPLRHSLPGWQCLVSWTYLWN